MLAAALALGLVAGACVTATRDGLVPAAGTPETGTPGPGATVTTTAAPSAAGTDPVPSTSPTAASSPGDTGSPGLAATPGDGGDTPPPSPSISTAPARYRSALPSIGYISLDESQAFVQTVTAGIRAAAAAAGVDLVACDPGWTREGVTRCATELAEAGVHGVISFQPFADLAAEVCRTTGDAPTVGIVYDQGPCQVSLLSIDQAEAGRLGGRALGRLAAERWGCEVVAFIGLGSGADDPIGTARMEGYGEGYEEHCALPADTRSLVDTQHLVTAHTKISKVLKDLQGKPIIVAGVSDSAVLGAIAAAEALGRERDLWYAGQLAEPEIRSAIACDGRVVGSVGQFPERFGAAVVPLLLRALEGADVPPTIDAELESVTATNVRQLFPDTPACGE